LLICKNTRIGYLLFLYLSVTQALLVAQEKKEKNFYTLLYGGPSLAFYKGNVNHTSDLKSKPAFAGGVSFLFRLNKSAYLFTGFNLLTHGNNFNSYFFADSSFHFYDKKLDYLYSCRFTDITLVSGIRINFMENTQLKKHFYGEMSWGIKRRFQSTLDVSSASYGNSVYYAEAGNLFDTKIPGKEFAHAVVLTSGYDANFREKKNGYFFALQFNYTINPFRFIQFSRFPNDIYLRERFLCLITGLRF